MSDERSTLVLYSDPDNPIHRRFEAELRHLMSRRTLKTYRTIPGLVRRLRHPGSLRTDLVVLCPGSAKDLLDLKKVRPLLVSTHRVVFVLPDRTEETIATAHAFYPRYIGFADDEMEDVFAVLARMLGRPPKKSHERDRHDRHLPASIHRR